MGNGQKLTIGTLEVKVASNGDVNVISKLIDPYGILTDADTGKIITDADVTLYYADTDRNTASGKTPGEVVQLPIIDGFKPNDNRDPQVSDKNGAYAFMVFPDTDYYITVTKNGYNKYTSPVIHVDKEIVKFDIKMNKSGNKDTIAVNHNEKQGSSSVKDTNQERRLPQAGSFVDFTVLVIIGIAFILSGIIYRINRRRILKK